MAELSDECELVSSRTVTLSLIKRRAAPLFESGGACLLEVISLAKAAFLVEVVVDRGMDGRRTSVNVAFALSAALPVLVVIVGGGGFCPSCSATCPSAVCPEL